LTRENVVPTSLFGDPGGSKPWAEEDPRWQTTRPEGDAAPDMQISGSAPAELHEAPGERHAQELFLTGSAAEALRLHLASSNEATADAHAIALFDPVRMWAPALIKSLSDSGGQPVERLTLRDANHFTTLATIERTRVVRRFDETVKLYHADVPSGIGDSAAVPVVLMERAQLAVVIVGPMHPESVTGMLEILLAATHAGSWRCPNLLFMLPPAAVWIANKVTSLGWPQPLHLTVLNESLGSTSAVWNALLGIWNRAKTLPHWSPPLAEDRPAAESVTTIHVGDASAEQFTPLAIDTSGDVGLGFPAAAAASPEVRPLPTALNLEQASSALLGLLANEGVIACALVDAGSGLALAREVRDSSAIDVDLVAAAATQLLRAHRLAARQSGFADPVDEIIVNAGSRQQLLRMVARHPGLFLCAVLDAGRSNLALTRYKLLEAEHALA
jgi:hypothetical protein